MNGVTRGTAMDGIILAARIAFSLLFITSGIFGHLMQAEGMAGYAASKGVPAAYPMVLLTGIMILVGGLSILLGVKPRMGAILLVIFLALTTFVIHSFWTIDDPQARMMDRTHFFKDLALLGGALMFYVFGTGRYSLKP